MNLTIPELSLIILIGPSGSGKSTFAHKHFKPTEVISSDFCRGLVSDDENNQSATSDAFDVLRYIVGMRLTRGLLTVIDATNVQPESRRPLIELAREHDVLPVAIVLDVPERVCHDRNKARDDRSFGTHVIRNQILQMRKSLRHLDREGFRYVYRLSQDATDHGQILVNGVSFVRQPLWTNRKAEAGPFDIVGDIHGCFDELTELLTKLGYTIIETKGEVFGYEVTPPLGRKAIFLGDLVDRGPKVVEVLKLAMSMVGNGAALCVPGNHDVKLMRYLQGRNVQVKHGLAETLEQLSVYPPTFHKQIEQFIDRLVSHYVLADGTLVVAHAGMKERYIGRASKRVREFALYGETTGETDDFGLPVRHNWAAEYRGDSEVIYGHTPAPEADWLNRTINIDTGCVFGGKLTALRWPERELIAVKARTTYAQSSRPFLPVDGSNPVLNAQQRDDDVLDLADVTGKRIITTRLHHTVTVRQENATAALEVMSRFAVNPKWLIYLPPTMSPTGTTEIPGLLEHPLEAFDYFRSQEIGKVVCQEKHMGSRAVAVICKNEDAAQRRFGIIGGSGVVYTRTGRQFFDNPAVETELLDIVRKALDAAGFWTEFASDWFCLDCELMPWSAKAQDLLRTQYAAVGSAATSAVAETVKVLERATLGYDAVGKSAIVAMLERQKKRQTQVKQYVDAYRRYCWTVHSVNDLKLAPFHLLACENHVFVDKDHIWHMETLARLSRLLPDTPLIATSYKVFDLADPKDVDAGVAWWEQLTSQGGEGMVVKPLDFVVRGKKGLVQPAVKCRGPEYLRIIYGPEYDSPENLVRLRGRGLGAKRSLALREFALGVEALERFIRKEPLRKVHECVFGVLAMESEPIDPRL